ncbi:RDD family protein [Streptomyces sp. NBC_00876]|uniref:RDD family protein n=1 Tax=Streptomyces sp. NBC_00876 TaxID=2975853 RepID=UPI003869B209|nr:RDD family protein [Streptomyces sp. NBC_00876]
MSAPTPAPGDDSPREGYYPDPSIPGYVRYWNGASWVPGTSRPAPQQGEAMPTAPAEETAGPQGPGPAAVDETGPVFFDEESYAGSRPEPATAWQADASRQTGFGGERDRRVSWGGAGQHGEQHGEQPEPGPDPRTPTGSSPADRTPADRTPDGHIPADRAPAARAPADRTPAVRAPADRTPDGHIPDGHIPADRTPDGHIPADRAPAVRAPAVRAQADDAPADRAPVDPRQPAQPAQPDPTGGALPGMRDGGSRVPEKTVAIRVGRPGGSGRTSGDAGRPPAEGTVAIRRSGPRDAQQPPADGTLSIRAIAPGPGAGTGTAPAAPQAATPPSAPPQQAAAPAPGELGSPLTPGPGGGSASWAQPAHQLPRPGQAARPQAPAQHQGPAFPQQSPPAERPDQPVVPWKPPAQDHFQQLAAARTAARPAVLGKRFAARVIDTVVLGALVGAVAVPLAARAADHINDKIDAAKLSGETVTVWLVDSTTAALAGAVIAAFLVLGVLLEALPTAKWGRTLGKKLCGLEVRDIESHDPPGFGAALRRWLVYGVLGVLVVGVVNVLWCVFDRPWRQCWHDKAAHTFVAGSTG